MVISLIYLDFCHTFTCDAGAHKSEERCCQMPTQDCRADRRRSVGSPTVTAHSRLSPTQCVVVACTHAIFHSNYIPSFLSQGKSSSLSIALPSYPSIVVVLNNTMNLLSFHMSNHMLTLIKHLHILIVIRL